MRRYEMMVILTDLLDEEAATELYERIKGMLDDQQATLVDDAWWGKRELMHEIHKRTHAWYGVLDFEGTTEAVAEVERQLKIIDEVVRFKTVRPEVRVRRVSA